MKLSPTETFAINRKSLADLALSCDLKPDAMRRDLATFNQEVLRLVNAKRLKTARLVLVETENDK